MHSLETNKPDYTCIYVSCSALNMIKTWQGEATIGYVFHGKFRCRPDYRAQYGIGISCPSKIPKMQWRQYKIDTFVSGVPWLDTFLIFGITILPHQLAKLYEIKVQGTPVPSHVPVHSPVRQLIRSCVS